MNLKDHTIEDNNENTIENTNLTQRIPIKPLILDKKETTLNDIVREEFIMEEQINDNEKDLITNIKKTWSLWKRPPY